MKGTPYPPPRTRHAPRYWGYPGDWHYRCSCGKDGWSSVVGDALAFLRKHRAKNTREG
ncbi:hypothetical protein [Streptomyces sp. NPDC059786]|uniref:hypothetical protein n=1 Tax=Streptomyces sp. NPDC059786 TaxID=3346946 RepID=UPI003649062A